MNQRELEDRATDIFERQDFDVKETETGFMAESDDVVKQVGVFSSEEFSEQDVVGRAEGFDLVFVDEPFAEVAEDLEAEISVLEQEDEEEYDLPSFEIIGEVAVINELVDVSREEAVEGILEYNPNVQTILLKTEPLSGEFRVGEYEKLYGEETETIHTEFGCDFKVDPTEVYYSERDASERKRIANQVDDGDEVAVFFAGVAPYPVIISKFTENVRITAYEKNPLAVTYARKNLELNDCEGDIDVVAGDLRNKTDKKFDRVIMPSPVLAPEFIDYAMESIRENGYVYLYRYRSDDGFERDFNHLDCVVSVRNREVSQESPKRTKYCSRLEIRK